MKCKCASTGICKCEENSKWKKDPKRCHCATTRQCNCFSACGYVPPVKQVLGTVSLPTER